MSEAGLRKLSNLTCLMARCLTATLVPADCFCTEQERVAKADPATVWERSFAFGVHELLPRVLIDTRYFGSEAHAEHMDNMIDVFARMRHHRELSKTQYDKLNSAVSQLSSKNFLSGHRYLPQPELVNTAYHRNFNQVKHEVVPGDDRKMKSTGSRTRILDGTTAEMNGTKSILHAVCNVAEWRKYFVTENRAIPALPRQNV